MTLLGRPGEQERLCWWTQDGWSSSLVGSQQGVPKRERKKKKKAQEACCLDIWRQIPEESAKSWKRFPGAEGAGKLPTFFFFFFEQAL